MFNQPLTKERGTGSQNEVKCEQFSILSQSMVHQTGSEPIFVILERRRLNCNLDVTVPHLCPLISDRELTESSVENRKV